MIRTPLSIGSREGSLLGAFPTHRESAVLYTVIYAWLFIEFSSGGMTDIID